MTALGILLQAIASDLRYVRQVFRVGTGPLAGIASDLADTGLVPCCSGIHFSPVRLITCTHLAWRCRVGLGVLFDLGVYFVGGGRDVLMIMTLQPRQAWNCG